MRRVLSTALARKMMTKTPKLNAPEAPVTPPASKAPLQPGRVKADTSERPDQTASVMPKDPAAMPPEPQPAPDRPELAPTDLRQIGTRALLGEVTKRLATLPARRASQIGLADAKEAAANDEAMKADAPLFDKPLTTLVDLAFERILGRTADAKAHASYFALAAKQDDVFRVITRPILSQEAKRKRVSTRTAAKLLAELPLHAAPGRRDEVDALCQRFARRLHGLRTVDQTTTERPSGPVFGALWIRRDAAGPVLEGWCCLQNPDDPARLITVRAANGHLAGTFTAGPGITLIAQPLGAAAGDGGGLAAYSADEMVLSVFGLFDASVRAASGGRMGRDRGLNPLNTATAAALFQGDNDAGLHPGIDLPAIVASAAVRFGAAAPEDIANPALAPRILHWYLFQWPSANEAPGHPPLPQALKDKLRAPAAPEGLSRHPITGLDLVFAAGDEARAAALFGDEANYLEHLCAMVTAPDGPNGHILDLLAPEALGLLNNHAEAAAPIPVDLPDFWRLQMLAHFNADHLGQVAIGDMIQYCAAQFVHGLRTGRHLGLIPDQWVAAFYVDDLDAEGRSRLVQTWGEDTGITDPDAAIAAFTEAHAAYPAMAVWTRGADWLAGPGVAPSQRTLADRFLAFASRCAHEATHTAWRGDWLLGHKGSTGLANNCAMLADGLAGTTPPFAPLVVEKPFGPQVRRRPARGPARSKPVIVSALNADRTADALALMPPDLVDEAVKFGFFLWETSRAPRHHAVGVAAVDEIWAPSDFVKSVYETSFPHLDTPVQLVKKAVTVPGDVAGVDLARFGAQPGETTFLAITDFASSIQRKNPLDTVRAFQTAFPVKSGENVRLFLKIRRIMRDHWSNAGGYWSQVERLMARDDRISLITGDFDAASYFGLLKAVDGYVSLHRGEGFGYGPAHAMLLDTPVIATDYSGTQDFCTADTAHLVAADEVAVLPGEMRGDTRLGVWAEPDITVAAKAFQTIHHGGTQVAARVTAARAHMETEYAPAAFRARIQDRLKAHGLVAEA